MRYLVGGAIQRLSPGGSFPLGTLGVNVIGCLVIGLLGGWADNRGLFSPEMRLLIFIGLLGGFTTFSTFGYETLALLRDGQLLATAGYVGLHLILGLAAVWIGYSLSDVT